MSTGNLIPSLHSSGLWEVDFNDRGILPVGNIAQNIELLQSTIDPQHLAHIEINWYEEELFYGLELSRVYPTSTPLQIKQASKGRVVIGRLRKFDEKGEWALPDVLKEGRHIYYALHKQYPILKRNLSQR